MADSRALSIAFIEKHPAAAARALTAMDREDAAALLEAIPSRFAHHAFTAMPAWSAAVIMSGMQEATVAAVLQRINYLHAAAILRLLDPHRRPGILEAVPRRLKRDFETSLSYPQDTIGAHMTVDIVALDRQHSVQDALQEVRRATHANVEVIYVIDSEKRLAGMVKTAALLRLPGDIALEAAMDSSVEPAPARALMAGVGGLALWGEYAEIPVRSRQGQLIGALPRKALFAQVSDHPADLQGLAGPLRGALGATLGGLLRLWANPADAALSAQQHGDGS